ncbi:hypothetical protein [Streptomyces sp. NPDC056291]|uniref:hypothetical protein n=1 Tax=unclassified Streptomyces TaxID=2593676 RepID=UPI0035E2F2BA
MSLQHASQGVVLPLVDDLQVPSEELRGAEPTIRLAERCALPRLVAEKVNLTGARNDGATWQPVKLSGKSGTWSARYDAPRHGFVSLKAEDWDDAGNRISQEVIRAFGLK